MFERSSRIGVRVLMRRDGSGTLIDHWSTEEAFAGHINEIAEVSRGKCARGAGQCCMNVSFESFSIEGEKETKATVSAYCAAEDCPNPKLPFDPPFEVARSRPGSATPIELSEVQSS